MSDFDHRQPDLRLIERAILFESAGCDFEQASNQAHALQTEVVLHLGALSKKLLGIFGKAIGNDPRRAASVAGAKERDWDAERKAIMDRKDNLHRDTQISELEADISRAKSIDAAYDKGAWDAQIELEDIVQRRAMALARMEPPLLDYAIDDYLPDEVVAGERNRGNAAGSIPNDKLVQITRAGIRFLGTGKKLGPKPAKRPGQDRFDEDLLIVDG